MDGSACLIWRWNEVGGKTCLGFKGSYGGRGGGVFTRGALGCSVSFPDTLVLCYSSVLDD